uniref:Uncharacterized protein n=1 Tax=Corethron hystrix TaxID=216773 RepID=A0A7S1FQT7_9STRA
MYIFKHFKVTRNMSISSYAQFNIVCNPSMTEYISLNSPKSKGFKKTNDKNATSYRIEVGYQRKSPTGINDFESRHEKGTDVHEKKVQHSEIQVRRVLKSDCYDHMDFLDCSSPKEEKDHSAHPSQNRVFNFNSCDHIDFLDYSSPNEEEDHSAQTPQNRVFNFDPSDHMDFLNYYSPKEEKNCSPRLNKKKRSKQKRMRSLSNQKNSSSALVNLWTTTRSTDTLSSWSCTSPMSVSSSRTSKSYSSKSNRKCNTNIVPSDFGTQVVVLCRSPGRLV